MRNGDCGERDGGREMMGGGGKGGWVHEKWGLWGKGWREGDDGGRGEGWVGA